MNRPSTLAAAFALLTSFGAAPASAQVKGTAAFDSDWRFTKGDIADGERATRWTENVGATIMANLIPIHEDAIEMRRDGRSPLDHALHDGEDYELLFTGQPGFYFAATRIGTIKEEPGIWLQQVGGEREPLEPKGWEHRL